MHYSVTVDDAVAPDVSASSASSMMLAGDAYPKPVVWVPRHQDQVKNICGTNLDIVIVWEFLRKSILTTFREKPKKNFFFFLNIDCFNINYLYKVYPEVD